MSIGMIMYHVLLFNNVSAPIRSLHRIYDEVNDAMIYSESFSRFWKPMMKLNQVASKHHP